VSKCQYVPTCPAYAQWNGVSCVCQTGYLLTQGTCQPVNKPVPSCPPFSQFNGVSCTCQQGYHQLSPGTCSACPAGTNWNGQQCSQQQQCDSGFVISPFNSECIPVGQLCGPGAKWNGATCCCLTGYSLIGKTCVQCPSGTRFDGSACSSFSAQPSPCSSSEVLISGQCQCASGLYRINGLCTQCPDFTSWNGVYCSVPNSNAREWCMGVPFSVQTPQGCQCQSGYFNLNGLCVSHQ
jgi:hypothetical protein